MNDDLPLPPPASALRASFGDRKPPDISRKITACVACRKQKIKCHMPNSLPPCRRCIARGLSCTVNRSLQMLLEDDSSWKHSVTRKIRVLETYMDTVRNSLNIPDSTSQDGILQDEAFEEPLALRPPDRQVNALNSTNATAPPPRAWEMRLDPDSGPATIPALCVGEVTESVGPLRNTIILDCISQRIVSETQAASLFEIYAHRLDHFLYRILGDSPSLQRIRSSSALLTAAICAVGALHSQELGFLFSQCQKAFLNKCNSLLFAQSSNIDDIRGLCIGAFWLHEHSWQLIGLAVRISTQCQLHRAIRKTLNNDKAAYLQTRLYYLVYVCDHHFSIAYGRPPMTRECESITASAQFLETEHATEDDARLVSQVEIWSIATKVFDTFGFSVEAPIASELVPKLRRFMIALDTWRADWNERFGRNSQVGDYPKKGVGLHFHFAKLYLCSHAFRGASMATEIQPLDAPSPHELPSELEEIATAAVLSAKSILRTIVNDSELQSYLSGLPLYFNTMIAFGVVFLLKVATRYCTTIRVDSAEVLALIAELGKVLRASTANMHGQHLLIVIAKGVETLLKKSQEAFQIPTGAHRIGMPAFDHVQQSFNTAHDDIMTNDFDWMNFDLLPTQSTLQGFGQWSTNIDFDNM